MLRVEQSASQLRHGGWLPGVWGSTGRLSPVAQTERIHLQCGRPGFNPWVRKISWGRDWLPTPVFLPGEFHGQRNLAGCRPWGCKKLDTTEWLTLPHFILVGCVSRIRVGGYVSTPLRQRPPAQLQQSRESCPFLVCQPQPAEPIPSFWTHESHHVFRRTANSEEPSTWREISLASVSLGVGVGQLGNLSVPSRLLLLQSPNFWNLVTAFKHVLCNTLVSHLQPQLLQGVSPDTLSNLGQPQVCMHATQSFSCAQLFMTSWALAHQAPLSLAFPRQEYWPGLPLPSPGCHLGSPRPAPSQGPYLTCWKTDAPFPISLSKPGTCLVHPCFSPSP